MTAPAKPLGPLVVAADRLGVGVNQVGPCGGGCGTYIVRYGRPEEFDETTQTYPRPQNTGTLCPACAAELERVRNEVRCGRHLVGVPRADVVRSDLTNCAT